MSVIEKVVIYLKKEFVTEYNGVYESDAEALVEIEKSFKSDDEFRVALEEMLPENLYKELSDFLIEGGA